jgi:transposase
MKAAPEPFLKAIAPDQEDRVVCVECRCTWYWLADLCAREGMPFVLGPALDMKALHGGTATNDTIDSQTIAVLRRGGRLPQAYVYPAARRATRDLLRRRLPLKRQRAALLAHVQHTNRQDNLPEIGKTLASKANRDGVAARCPELAVQKRGAGALALIDYAAQGLRDVELPIAQTATQHHAQTLYRLQSVPGIGQILSLVLRDEIHDLTRFPRVQDFVSSCRLVTCAKESAGKRSGTSGAKIGKAYLTWAFSEAAVLFWRNNPAGQKYLARSEHQHGTGKALSIVAHKLARAVYGMRKRDPAFDMQKFLHGSGSGAAEPHASRDDHGLSLAYGALMLARRQGTPRSTSAP